MKKFIPALALFLAIGAGTAYATFVTCCAPFKTTNMVANKLGTNQVKFDFNAACAGGGIGDTCCYCVRVQMTRQPNGPWYDYGYIRHSTLSCIGGGGNDSITITLPAGYPSGTYIFTADFYHCSVDCGSCDSSNPVGFGYAKNFTF